MESLYIWLIIFGGTGLVVLGIFLFTADRKLGKQQQPQITEATVGKNSPHKEVIDRDSQLRSELAQTKSQIDQLTIRNKALLAEIASLSNKLVASEKTVADLQERSTSEANVTSEKPRIHPANGQERTRTAGTLGDRKLRFGIVPATVAIAILGAIAIGLMRTGSDESLNNVERRPRGVASIERSGLKEPAVAPNTESDQDRTRIHVASDPSEKPSQSLAALKKTEDSKATSAARSASRLKGTFEITRPTRVYSAPSEISLLIDNAEPGMKINVVDSRDGWLEIRSGQGRRSGFVRQESAVRIDHN